MYQLKVISAIVAILALSVPGLSRPQDSNDLIGVDVSVKLGRGLEDVSIINIRNETLDDLLGDVFKGDILGNVLGDDLLGGVLGDGLLGGVLEGDQLGGVLGGGPLGDVLGGDLLGGVLGDGLLGGVLEGDQLGGVLGGGPLGDGLGGDLLAGILGGDLVGDVLGGLLGDIPGGDDFVGGLLDENAIGVLLGSVLGNAGSSSGVSGKDSSNSQLGLDGLVRDGVVEVLLDRLAGNVDNLIGDGGAVDGLLGPDGLVGGVLENTVSSIIPIRRNGIVGTGRRRSILSRLPIVNVPSDAVQTQVETKTNVRVG